MVIAQIIPAFGLAGAEVMCENLIYELLNKSNRIIVISMYDCHSPITERLESTGVDVRYLGKKYGADFSMISKLKRIFKNEKVEVVHTHLYSVHYAMPAAILAGIKCKVHTVHNVAQKECGRVSRIINRFLFKIFGVIPVALSGIVKKTICEEYHIKSEKVPIIYNGIDLSKCISKTDYFIRDKFKILHIGRFSPQKNHIGLITAFKTFHSEVPNSVLQLIGDGELKSKMENYVNEYGLDDCVEFLGAQSNVYPFLNNADMFVLPSNYEGMPMTLIEAMGTGLPISAAAVGGVPDMLDANCAILTGLDSNEIADSFRRYYYNADLRKQYGTNARIRSEEFSSKKMAEEYTKIYKGEL